MVVERRSAAGAWYWKDLPTRTLAFEKLMYTAHKSSE
jgi:hypothetical protein